MEGQTGPPLAAARLDRRTTSSSSSSSRSSSSGQPSPRTLTTREDDDDGEVSSPLEDAACSLPLRHRRGTHGHFGTTDTLCETPQSLACDTPTSPDEWGPRHRLHPASGHAEGRAASWLRALSTHPVITVLAGLAQIVGFGRVASSLSAVSLSSLHSVDIDHFEEYDLSLAGDAKPGCDALVPGESPLDGYGFFVAITPPHQPQHHPAAAPPPTPSPPAAPDAPSPPTDSPPFGFFAHMQSMASGF